MAPRKRALVVLLALALAGCGSDSNAPGLTTGQQQGLIAQLEAVRTAAAAGDLKDAQAALRRFRSSVAQLRRDHAIDRATAARLRAGALRVLVRVKSDNAPAPAPTPATPTTPTTTAPVPVQPAPAPKPQPGKKPPKPKPEKHGKGHGKGEGNGGD